MPLRYLILCPLVLLLVASPGAMGQDEDSVRTTLKRAITLYAKNIGSEEVGRFEAGTEVYVFGQTSAMAFVSANGSRGWAPISVLEETPGLDEIMSRDPIFARGLDSVLVHTDIESVLYDVPRGQSIGKIGAGSEVWALERQGPHVRVRYGDRVGYVFKAMIRERGDLSLLPSMTSEEATTDGLRGQSLYRLSADDITEMQGSRHPFRILDFGPDYPNSASGVNLEFELLNVGPRIIKYLTFDAVPYNEVGDVQRGRIRGHSTFSGRITGPIEPSQRSSRFTFENAWYNGTITCTELLRVRVEYIDGSSYTYARELPRALSPVATNDCSYAAQRDGKSFVERSLHRVLNH